MYYSASDADRAKAHFKNIFSKKQLPDEMPIYEISESAKLIDILCDAKILSSKSEARRMIRQNAVKIDGDAVADENIVIQPDAEKVVKIGKRKFLRIVPTLVG